MNPGKLNRRIVLQARTLTRDSTGSRVETWADSASPWAELVKTSATEITPADADRSADTCQFRVRYRSFLATPDAASNYRILYQSRFFNISGITQEGVKTSLLIDARAIQKIS